MGSMSCRFVDDIRYMPTVSSFLIIIKNENTLHSSCEIEDFVETDL